jgi:hypothetical protein
MRPSQNAFFGYSYQQCITFLMFAKMDVEREIEAIEIEAVVNNQSGLSANFSHLKKLKRCFFLSLFQEPFFRLHIFHNHHQILPFKSVRCEALVEAWQLKDTTF